MYGCKVLDLVAANKWGQMVALQNGQIVSISLAESRKERKVDPSGEMVRFAKSMGISFGD